MLAIRCTLLFLLSVTSDLSAGQHHGPIYRRMTERRALEPLLEASVSSRIQCCLHCLRRASCTHWSYSQPQCALYPEIGSQPDRSTLPMDVVWLDRWLPAGYQLVPDSTSAMRLHQKPLIRGPALTTSPPLPRQCAVDHANARPAFLNTNNMVNFAKGLFPRQHKAWVGIKKISGGPVYGNYALNETVDLKSAWFAPWSGGLLVLGSTCIRMAKDGMDLNGCRDSHGYLCEYVLRH